MTTTPPENTRPDYERRGAAAYELGAAAMTLRTRGQDRAARSIENFAQFVTRSPNEEATAAGLSALLMWARRETTDPLLVRAGDRVRVTLRDGDDITTGVWKLDCTGQPMVQRDDTGDLLPVDLGQHRVEVLYLDRGSRAGSWSGALWNAATVLRSAWLLSNSRHLDEPEDVSETEHERASREQYGQRRTRERLCLCGSDAAWRAVAWAEREAVELDDKGFRWHEPATYGSETVCSQNCGEQWATKFLDQAVLPPGVQLLFRLDRFQYRVEFEELPARLAQARAAAVRIGNVLDGAALEHVAGNEGSVETLTQSARPSVAELLDVLLLLTEPRW